MGEEKVSKGNAISRGLKAASSECHKCINGYSREEWGKIFLCYFIFYGCLAAWMSVHVSIMVDLLPERAKYVVVGADVNGDNLLTFTMGEANYHSWLHKAVAFGNEGDCSASGCGREPWATNAAISTSNEVASNEAYFQIRLLNQWDLKTMPHDGYGQSVKCTAREAADVGTVQFSNVRNGFSLNQSIQECTEDVSATGFNSRNCNPVYYHTGTAHEFFQVVWQEGSTAPHIVTFLATYSGGATEKRISFNCERGTPPGYSGDLCTDCDGSWEMEKTSFDLTFYKQ